MWISTVFQSVLIVACLHSVQAQSSWSYEDASVVIQGKGAAFGGASAKEKFSPTIPLSTPITLGPSDTIKLTLTIKEDETPKRPHQAFLTLREPTTGLEESYVLNVKDTGRGRVEVSQKDLPFQFVSSKLPLEAALTIGSFGLSTPLKAFSFKVRVIGEDSTSVSPSATMRYGKLSEINHIFRSRPKSPPRIITLFFTAAALATLPALVLGWLSLGANLNHLSEALGTSPLSHSMFFGSLVGLEVIFFMYYSSWNLFQTLPAATAFGLVAFLSGSRALSEVQARRLAGKR